MYPDVARLARALVDIPSPTGFEAEVTSYLAEYLGGLGYRVDLQEVAPGRHNLFATPGEAARVVFSTHVDTVGPFVPAREDDEFLYGRGTCDAKGIAAAQIAAVERLRARGVRDVGLLFLVDEEAGSLGAYTANLHPRASECVFLVGGEPTNNLLATAAKGSLRIRLKARGKAAHSAYPECGSSAIDDLLDALASVRFSSWPEHADFGETTLNVGVVRGGTASNVLAAEAEADVHFRLACDSQRVVEILERVVPPRVDIEYLSSTEPIRLDDARVARAAHGLGRTLVRFTTDLPHLARWGTPLLVGPGSILDAHTDGERISKRQLAEAVDIYDGLGAHLHEEATAARATTGVSS
jgi:acetylornithine deacetylase